MDNYYNWPCFEDIYLEDSFVLNISEAEDCIEFNIEAVLRENHPSYEKPPANKQYCYKNAIIRFPNPSSITWIRRSNLKTIDIDGSSDIGNIDTFVRVDDVYHLSGSWGDVEISSESVDIVYK